MATQLKAVEEAPIEAVLAESIDSEAPDNQSGEPRDYEAEARSRGWTPEDEFKGDKSRWVDAEDFVKNSDEYLPFLKKKARVQDQEIKQLKRAMEDAKAYFSKSEERAFKRALAELKTQQRAAVEVGDVDAHDAISKKIDELRDDIPNAKDGPDLAMRAREAEFDWRDKNAWYDKGGRATDFANYLVEKYRPKAKDMEPEDFFDMIAKETLERYPDAASETPRREARNAVEGVSGNRVARGARVFANLPKEAQTICDRMIKNGYPVTRESYTKDYDWS